MLSESELDPFFDAAGFDAFRLECLQAYAVDVESPRLRSYLAGEPYDTGAEPRAWYDFIAAWTRRGVRFRKARVLRDPLSEYLRWECEWSYTATERLGQRTYILDLAEVGQPPELPDYDFWMFDEAVVLRFHYDDSGAFAGAEQLPASEVSSHVAYRDAAIHAATSFPEYWKAHPQYWRENWTPADGDSGAA